MIRQLRCALAFLTIVPVSPGPLSDRDLLGSCRFFPGAGWLLGGILAGVAWLGLLARMPPLLLAPILVSLLAWLTRGLHLDGVADLCDGLGGSFRVERRLAIMKDSAIGAFGVVALVLLLLLKTAALVVLLGAENQGLLLLLLAMSPVVARWAMLTLAWRSNYPRQAGTGHFMVGRVGPTILLPAALFLLPGLGAGWAGGAVVGAGLLVVLVLRHLANSRLGGITGDVLGAAIEGAETMGWLVAAMAISWLYY